MNLLPSLFPSLFKQLLKNYSRKNDSFLFINSKKGFHNIFEFFFPFFRCSFLVLLKNCSRIFQNSSLTQYLTILWWHLHSWLVIIVCHMPLITIRWILKSCLKTKSRSFPNPLSFHPAYLHSIREWKVFRKERNESTGSKERGKNRKWKTEWNQ